jgi:hypothetical protein
MRALNLRSIEPHKTYHLRLKMGMNTAGKSPRYFHLPMRNTC